MGIVSARVSEVIEGCAQLAVENFEDDEWLSIQDVALKVGAQVQKIGWWINQQQLPAKTVGGKKYVRMSDAEFLKELRDVHGREWYKHAPWYGKVNNVVAPKREASLPGDEMSDEAARISKRLMERARALYEKGSFQASSELIWAVCDEFDILN